MNSQSRPLILINNQAARAHIAWPRIKEALTQHKVRFDFRETMRPGDAEAWTRAALQSGCGTIAIVGGDGTLSEAASGFFEMKAGNSKSPQPINSAAALAILPAGTGDDFARGLVGGRAPLETWLELFVVHCRNAEQTRTRTVDMLHGRIGDGAQSFICLNAATLGIGAEVAGRVAAQGSFMRLLSGEARFALAALGALAQWRERRVSVQVDEGERIECQSNLIAVVNGLYAGGGMMFAPAARVDDGCLDVMTTCGVGRAMVLRELPRIHSGGHLANPKVRVMRGTSVRIEALSRKDALAVEADGDVRGCTPVEFRVIPSALRIVV
ncbi:MAG: hypothetical protein H0T92_20685 [Pyrinomonadaceae bacterium]|nr:hypothetical protein [Pyrinomonadaceae bacterium]